VTTKPRKQPTSYLALRERLSPYLLLVPLLLLLMVLLGFPFFANIFYSFSSLRFETLRSPSWIGIGNYVQVLQDSAFWSALGFSARFAIWASLSQLLIGFALALILEPLLSKYKPLLAFLLLPMMISPVLMGIMYRLILNDFVGVIPQYLSMVGIHVSLLTPPYVIPTLIVIEVLQWTPFAFLIFFTALQTIPGDLVEAAKIDGAAPINIFRFITLPLMVPAIAIAGFIRFIDSFRVFDHIFVLTGGGPGTLTTSISIYIYKSFFQQEQLGQAIAASMLLLILSLGPLYISMRYVLRGARL
jgi:multiple sugar transport system permease protein